MTLTNMQQEQLQVLEKTEQLLTIQTDIQQNYLKDMTSQTEKEFLELTTTMNPFAYEDFVEEEVYPEFAKE